MKVRSGFVAASATLVLSFFIVSACGSPKPDPAVTALEAPSGLAASPMGTGVHLVWRDNSSDEQEFELERSGAGAGFVKVKSVPFDTIQHHDQSVTSGEQYVYRIRAAAGSIVSPYSNEVTITAPISEMNDDAGVEDLDGGTERLPDGGYSFQEHIVPLFNRSCGAGDNSCHSRVAYGPTPSGECRGWLALENASLGSVHPTSGNSTGCSDLTLYERLTQLDSWMCDGPRKKYIVASDLYGSQLFQVVAGDPTGGGTCEKAPGVPMTAMPPSTSPALTAASIEMLRTWIQQGAPNN